MTKIFGRIQLVIKFSDFNDLKNHEKYCSEENWFDIYKQKEIVMIQALYV